MLIAVASKDGREINQHFGHADRFLIYDVREESINLIDEKKVERYCTFDPEHPMRKDVLKKTVEMLDGCRAVVSAQIGEHPKGELERLGIESYTIAGPIKPSLAELAKIL